MMVLSIPLVMQGVAVMALANWRQKGKMVVRNRAVMKIWGENQHQRCSSSVTNRICKTDGNPI